MLTQVSDAVLHPPADAKYENLKRCIIERFSESEQRKMTKMLSELELGDKKPSQLYNELKQLGGSNVTEEFLITIWLQRLPIHVRRICASVQGDKKQLPTVAKEIMDCGHSQVNSIAIVIVIDLGHVALAKIPMPPNRNIRKITCQRLVITIDGSDPMQKSAGPHAITKNYTILTLIGISSSILLLMYLFCHSPQNKKQNHAKL